MGAVTRVEMLAAGGNMSNINHPGERVCFEGWTSVTERYPDKEIEEIAAGFDEEDNNDPYLSCKVIGKDSSGSFVIGKALYTSGEFCMLGNIKEVTHWRINEGFPGPNVCAGPAKRRNKPEQRPLLETIQTGRCRHCLFHPDHYVDAETEHLKMRCPMYIFGEDGDEGWNGHDYGFCHEFKAWEEERKMRVMLDDWGIMPTRAHETDAGLDLRTPITFTIKPGERSEVNTGVHVQLPEATVGLIKSKSGLNTKYGITCEGVIDEGYTGAIRAVLYNHGDSPVKFVAGEKIAQLVVTPCLYVSVEVVDELTETDRGNDGFGSTGRF